ncbi:MAG: tRNA-binding protein [Lacibacter sp.]
MMNNLITWNDFEKIQIITGTIVKAEEFLKARNLSFNLTIDFGKSGIKQSSAQITHHYTTNELVGKQIIAVVNFPPKQIADFISECLVLGVYDENNQVILLTTDKPTKNGEKIG